MSLKPHVLKAPPLSLDNIELVETNILVALNSDADTRGGSRILVVGGKEQYVTGKVVKTGDKCEYAKEGKFLKIFKVANTTVSLEIDGAEYFLMDEKNALVFWEY